MSQMNLRGSYFAIENPLRWIDRRLNGFTHEHRILLNQRPLVVCWSDRAGQALQALDEPLFVELQLYFSCVVKKRVIFHHQSPSDAVKVNTNLCIAFRAVTAAACTPEVFASQYPEGRELSGEAAWRMQPTRLEIDFRNNQWQGEFAYQDTPTAATSAVF